MVYENGFNIKYNGSRYKGSRIWDSKFEFVVVNYEIYDSIVSSHSETIRGGCPILQHTLQWHVLNGVSDSSEEQLCFDFGE